MFARQVVEKAWKIWALAADEEKCGLLKFLRDLGEADRNRVIALLDLVAERGPRALPSDRCHDVDKDNSIFQFRVGTIRIMWFYDDGHVIICTHAFVKKRQKTPKREVERAIAAKKKFHKNKSKLIVLS